MAVVTAAPQPSTSSAVVKPRHQQRKQLTAEDLKLTEVDHGFVFEQFQVGDAVLVFFVDLPESWVK